MASTIPLRLRVTKAADDNYHHDLRELPVCVLMLLGVTSFGTMHDASVKAIDLMFSKSSSPRPDLKHPSLANVTPEVDVLQLPGPVLYFFQLLVRELGTLFPRVDW